MSVLWLQNGHVVQSLSCVWFCGTLWTAVRQASLSFTISQNLLKLISIKLVMPSNHLILCFPLLLPSIFPSIRVFSSESVFCIRWPEYWRFSFSISPSNEYSGLILFRIDWFDLFAVQGTLNSLLSGGWGQRNLHFGVLNFLIITILNYSLQFSIASEE